MDTDDKNTVEADARPDVPAVEDADAGRETAGGTEVSESRSGYPRWEHLLAIVGVLVVSAFFASLVFLLLGLDKNLSEGFRTFATYVIQMTLPMIFIAWQRRRARRPKRLMSLNVRRTNPALVLWGVVLLVVSSVVLEPLLALFPERYLEMLNQAIGTGGWAILTTVIVAPVLEEVLFRGMILGSLRESGNTVRAVVLSSLIFGIIHIIPQQVVNAFVVGLILGLVYVRTGSLFAVILIHALNNAVAYIQTIVLQDDTTMRQLIGNDTLYYICYALCVLVLLGSLWALVRATRRGETSVPPAVHDNNKDI